VRIPGAGFEMLKTEVTASQYAAFSAFAGVRMPTQPTWYAGPDHPVTNVTWDEARGFCAWAGGRLPTDAEWERAAVGRTRREPYPWEGRSSGHANLQGQAGIDRWPFTAPVGSMPANDFGLYDMWGNVWEWTDDVSRNPDWPGYEMRVVRGASWDTSPRPSRVWARIGLSRAGRHNLYVGFRCAR
jgi:formylglycine-generating enzyme required for sulfatase activity